MSSFRKRTIPADAFKICKERIDDVIDDLKQLTTAREDTVMNRKQCKLLLRKLSELQQTLGDIVESQPLDEKSSAVLDELHRVITNAWLTIIKGCRFSNCSEGLRSAIVLGGTKENFSKFLYDVQWYTSVLLSTLTHKSGEFHKSFEPTMSSGLNDEFELLLLLAAKDDRRTLKNRLQSWQLEDPKEQQLAQQVLKKMQAEEGEESSASSPASHLLLQVDPQDLTYRGTINGDCNSAVREVVWLGGTYAMKICCKHLCTKQGKGKGSARENSKLEKEIAAFKKLRRHPHIVQLLCVADREKESYLVMERMHIDLASYLRGRKSNESGSASMSEASAVDLMLQVAEGVKYMHSKRMAHCDIKSANILLNLAQPHLASSSSISAAKIADFGSTVVKDNQALNTSASMWVAPEVSRVGPHKLQSRYLNYRKIDVYAFAIVCSEILSLDVPYPTWILGAPRKQTKAGERLKLLEKCHPKLARLITRCWDQRPHQRPEFQDICRDLRYIKWLLLKEEHTFATSSGQEEFQRQDILKKQKITHPVSVHDVTELAPEPAVGGHDGASSVEDERNLVYSKMQALKESYLEDMVSLYELLQTRSTQLMPAEQLQKLKQYKDVLHRMIPYLRVSKDRLPKEFNTGKVDAFEAQIINIMKTFKKRRQRSTLACDTTYDLKGDVKEVDHISN